MAARTADAEIVAKIRLLASDPTKVQAVHSGVVCSLLTHDLTIDDVCDKIVQWIDAGERVKPTILHSISGKIGQPAYEMKPRINGTLFYLKVTLEKQDDSDEYMLLLSAHPNY